MSTRTWERWRVGPSAHVRGERDGYVTVKSESGRVVARCDYNGLPLDDADANARLIAAAPELLEACERAIHGDGSLDGMRAAIEKARGP